MSVQFTPWFKVQIDATARKMVKEKLDVCAIPEGLGMVLVRMDSTEFHRRRDADSGFMIVPKMVPVDGQNFFVCEC